MSEPTMLRAVPDHQPPLSRDELQELGNDLVTRARVAAIDAVRASMHSEFVEKGRPVQRADIRRWRGRARSALKAWREVEAITTELLNALERTAATGEEREP